MGPPCSARRAPRSKRRTKEIIMNKLIVSIASTFALSLSACGAGSSVANALFPPTVSVMPSLLSHTATGTSIGGGTMAATGADGSPVVVGDWGPIEIRGFMRFDLSAIPAGAEILDADLRVYQGNVNETPYPDLGELRVDHMAFGALLDNADYNAPALAMNYGTLSVSAALDVKTLDVTDAVRADRVAGRAHTDVRFRFQHGPDGAPDADFVQLNDAEDTFGTGQVPELIVTWRKP